MSCDSGEVAGTPETDVAPAYTGLADVFEPALLVHQHVDHERQDDDDEDGKERAPDESAHVISLDEGTDMPCGAPAGRLTLAYP